MINAHQGLSQFVEGKYAQRLKDESLVEFYKVKAVVVEVLNSLCTRFRLNTKFLKETNVKVHGHDKL